jgi:uncharacterized protein (TIGR03083 family)
MRPELWASVHAERAALVRDLTNEQVDWTTPSLCAGWDIRDVLVHLAATATLSLSKFTVELVAAGFRPQRIADRQITRGRQFPPVHALDALRNAIYATASPPQPTITRLIEIVVHSEDIRQPLHITHTYDTTHLKEALAYLSHDHLFGAKTLVSGLQLVATDADIVLGHGARVEGDAASLLLAAAGRPTAFNRLSGPGSELLRQRLN